MLDLDLVEADEVSFCILDLIFRSFRRLSCLLWKNVTQDLSNRRFLTVLNITKMLTLAYITFFRMKECSWCASDLNQALRSSAFLVGRSSPTPLA